MTGTGHDCCMVREIFVLIMFVGAFGASRSGIRSCVDLGATPPQPTYYVFYGIEPWNSKLQDMLNEEYIALGPDLELVKQQEMETRQPGPVIRFVLWLRRPSFGEVDAKRLTR